jgi:probable rRNA maturation factor
MIEVLNTQTKYRVPKRALASLAARLVRHYRLGSPELVLSFVGEAAIRRLNRDFLKKDKVTDVLSFPMGWLAADGRYYLGDIVIAPARAARQAREKGHSLERELGILVIHGFLHLLGYDHGGYRIEKEEERARARFLDRRPGP